MGRGRGVAGVLACLVLASGGCHGVVGPQGRGGQVEGTYYGGTLWADVPASVRVRGIVAAADQGLRDRGYAVKRVAATDEAGKVTAEPPRAGLLESVEVSVRRTADATRIGVVVKPMGDQDRSRAIMDAVLARLGM